MELGIIHLFAFLFSGKVEIGRFEGGRGSDLPKINSSLFFFFSTWFEPQTKNKIFLLIDNAIQRSGCQSCIQNFRLGLWRSNEKNGKAVTWPPWIHDSVCGIFATVRVSVCACAWRTALLLARTHMCMCVVGMDACVRERGGGGSNVSANEPFTVPPVKDRPDAAEKCAALVQHGGRQSGVPNQIRFAVLSAAIFLCSTWIVLERKPNVSHRGPRQTRCHNIIEYFSTVWTSIQMYL